MIHSAHWADRPTPQPPADDADVPLPTPARTPEGLPIPPFTPWAPLRRRGRGWHAEAQRAFVAELARHGLVGRAAAAVGRSARSAYLLRDKDGAESFAAAWDAACDGARAHADSVSLESILHGEPTPVFRAGRFTGWRVRRDHRLLLAALRAGLGRAASPAEEGQAIAAQRHRLERWEAQLRREAMDRADGTADARARAVEGAAEAAIWTRELARADRLERTRRIRAAVARTREGGAEPSVRLL